MSSDDALERRPPRRLLLGAGALAAGLAAAEALVAPVAAAAVPAVPAVPAVDDVDGFTFDLDPATRLASVRRDGVETSALFLATALGAEQGPRWTTDRILPPVTPGFAQWTAEPAFDTALAWLGDSTGELNRSVFQFASEYARRNPGIRVVYDKMNLGGGGNVVADPTANPPAVPSPAPMPVFSVFKDGDTTGTYSRTWNTTTWAQGGGEDQHQPLPGLAGYTMRLPACARFSPWGANDRGSSLTRGFVGVDVQPTTWLPSSNMVLLAQDDAGAARGRGTVLRIRTDGRVELRGSSTGGASDPVYSAVSSVPVTAVPGYRPGARIAVGMRFDLDTGGRSVFTPLYRIGGHGATWLPLGSAQPVAGVNAWFGSESVPWEVGGGTTFRGDWFEAVVRVTDENGPDLIPRLPQMWEYNVAFMKGTLRGGRTLWIENLSWPQHGLEDFADRTDIGKPGTAVFTRTWNRATASIDNVYSVMDMLPLLPYGVTVWNSNHNESDTGSKTLTLWRRAHNSLVIRTPGADRCILIQNPTLRQDPNTAESPPGSGRRVFDQSYLLGLKRAHDLRIAQAGSLARELGCAVLDGRSNMVDYVRNGGALQDLVQVGGEQLHPTAAGARVLALGLLNQMTRTEFGARGILP